MPEFTGVLASRSPRGQSPWKRYGNVRGRTPRSANGRASLATSISENRWSDQRGSLMRGLAFGILDRRGERYRLALAHRKSSVRGAGCAASGDEVPCAPSHAFALEAPGLDRLSKLFAQNEVANGLRQAQARA